MERDLAGLTAIITGAAGTIGTAVSLILAERGANIVASDVEGANFAHLEAQFPAHVTLMTCVADMRDPAQVEALVSSTSDRFGGVDILFNNAGIEGAIAPIESWSVEDFDRIADINVRGVFLAMKYVLPVMYQQKSGSIVNVSSIAGFKGYPRMIGYIMSKHAVIGMTRVAALEAADHNVRVNCIAPGAVQGQMTDRIDMRYYGTIDNDDRAAFIPAKRYAKPEEVAALVGFLASPAASYITGGIYAVDGGVLAS